MKKLETKKRVILIPEQLVQFVSMEMQCQLTDVNFIDRVPEDHYESEQPEPIVYTIDNNTYEKHVCSKVPANATRTNKPVYVADNKAFINLI